MKFLLKNYWILIGFIIVKMVLQLLVVNPIYELHRDEFLHIDQATHLAAGFQSVPPFTSWVSVIILWLGSNVFWVRFFPALFGALTIMFAWLIVEAIGGRLFAKIMVALAMLFSVFVRLNILYQPNSFDYLAWTMVFYFIIQYFNTQKIKWLYAVSVSVVLGLLNKYNMAFLILGIIPAIIFTHPKLLFKQKHFYLAIGLAAFLIVPNILWQVFNRFPFFHHMHALNQYQLVNINRTDILKDQFMFFIGSLPLIIGAFVGIVFYKPFKSYRFVGITYIIVISVYCFLKAKSYYALGLYPVILALGSVYIDEQFNKGWKRLILGTVVIFNLFAFMPVFQYVIPREAPETIIAHAKGYESFGLLRWEDGRNHPLPQDFADMLGWSEMAEKAKVAYNSIPLNERDKTLIFTDNYGQAGAVNYYNRGLIPQAYSFCTDYIFWIPTLKSIRNVVLVGKRPDDKVLKYFQSVKLMATIENKYARECGTEIYLLSGASTEFTALFYKLRDRRIREFDIY
jgi:hypothetical protein